MRVSVLATIVLGLALLLSLLGVAANTGIIAPPEDPSAKALEEARRLAAEEQVDLSTTVEVTETEHDFGPVIKGEPPEWKHSFVFKNTGTNPLVLRKISTSCSCVFSEGAEKPIAPGESAAVIVGIRTSEQNGPLDKSAEIGTNDRKRRSVVLRVKADVMPPVELPPPLYLHRVLAHETVARNVKIIARHDRPFRITGHKFSKADTAQHFQASYRPLESTELPEGAKSGWQVSVTVQPDMASGVFRQRLDLTTDLEKSPVVSVNIEGTVVSDISLVGVQADFNPKYNILSLGTIRRAHGTKAALKINVGGKFRDQLVLGAPKCDPEFLRASLGETRPVGDAATETPLEIEVPPDSPVMSRLGTGRGEVGEVTIPTNHPSIKEIHVLVQFAIEP